MYKKASSLAKAVQQPQAPADFSKLRLPEGLGALSLHITCVGGIHKWLEIWDLGIKGLRIGSMRVEHVRGFQLPCFRSFSLPIGEILRLYWDNGKMETTYIGVIYKAWNMKGTTSLQPQGSRPTSEHCWASCIDMCV